jgi:serine/threonine protein kinase
MSMPTDLSPENKKLSKNISKDHFKIIKVIGRGSFGKVFLVQKKDTKEHFAMKVLKKENIYNRN